jgi:haloalkane dehalogenase
MNNTRLVSTNVVRPDWIDPKEFPFASNFTEIEENNIHYIDEGEGPVLVFLHGMPLWSYQYRTIIKHLRDHFRCIALDYPGFGLSVAAKGFRNTVLGNIQLVEAFLSKLNIKSVTLVLHDISTPVGIGVAERNPQLLRGLVLANGFGFPLDEYPSIYAFVKFLGSRSFRFLAVQFDFFTWYTVKFLGSRSIRFLSIHSDPLVPRHPTTIINQGQLSPASRRAYFTPFKDRSRRHHQADFFESVAKGRDLLVDIERQSRQIAHLPVLIAFGDADATYKVGWHERFARMFPNHRMNIIKGSHHFPQEYAPDSFAAAIRRWWDDVTQRNAQTIAKETNKGVLRKENPMIESIRTPEERFRNLPGYSFQSRYTEVAGLRLHFLDEGTPDADSVLLLHGNLSWSYLYRKIIPILSSAHHRVVAPDLIGFGQSDKPVRREDYSFQRHVDWMRRLIELLGLRDITVVGHDWGGLIALRLAAEDQSRFARIVASNTFLPVGHTPPSKELLQLKKMSLEVPDLRPSEMVQKLTVSEVLPEVLAAYDAPFPEEKYKAGARIFPLLIPTSPDDPSAEANLAAWEVLKRWQKPFLTAFSDSDPVFSRGGSFSLDGLSPEEYLQRTIPGAKDRSHPTIRNAGHFLQEDKGPELAHVIADFIAATPLISPKAA